MLYPIRDFPVSFKVRREFLAAGLACLLLINAFLPRQAVSSETNINSKHQKQDAASTERELKILSTLHALAILHSQLGRLRKATNIELYIIQRKNRLHLPADKIAENLRALGEFSYERGSLKDAEQFFSRGIAAIPTDSSTNALMRGDMLMNLGRTMREQYKNEGAVTPFKQAISSYFTAGESTSCVDRLVKSFLNLAQSQLLSGDLEGAERSASQALARSRLSGTPDMSSELSAQLVLAKYYQKQGEPERALEYSQSVINFIERKQNKSHLSQPDAYVLLEACRIAGDGEKMRNAREVLREAKQQAAAHNKLGLATSDLRQAINEVRGAVSCDTGNYVYRNNLVSAYIELSNTLLKENKTSEALSIVYEAKLLEPENMLVCDLYDLCLTKLQQRHSLRSDHESMARTAEQQGNDTVAAVEYLSACSGLPQSDTTVYDTTENLEAAVRTLRRALQKLQGNANNVSWISPVPTGLSSSLWKDRPHQGQSANLPDSLQGLVEFKDKRDSAFQSGTIIPWSENEKEALIAYLSAARSHAAPIFARATAYGCISLYRVRNVRPYDYAALARRISATNVSPELFVSDVYFEMAPSFERVRSSVDSRLWAIVHELTHLSDPGSKIDGSKEWCSLTAGLLGPSDDHTPIGTASEQEYAWTEIGLPSAYAMKNRHEALAEYCTALCLLNESPPSAQINAFLRNKILTLPFVRDESVDLVCRGKKSLDKSDLNAAMRYFNDAIKLDPEYSNAYFHRSSAWYARGELEKAYADMQRSMQLLPEDEQIRRQWNLRLRKLNKPKLRSETDST